LRREVGNPPGKHANPIGDQLTWEQILTHFKGKRRLWIISRDGDYGTVYGGKGFLNRFLYDELRGVAPDAEVYLFPDTVEGIKHFVDKTGVKAEKRLTPEEVEEIEKEEKSLPQLTAPDDAVRETMAAIQKFRYSDDAMREAMAAMEKFRAPDDAMREAMAAMEKFRSFDEASLKAKKSKSLGAPVPPHTLPQKGADHSKGGDKKSR